MNRSRSNSRLNVKIGIVATVVIVGLVLAIIMNAILQRPDDPEPLPVDQSSGLTGSLRDDSHRLDDEPDATVTVVEFLDFECEACGAFYPYVEALREKYDGRITYAIRYFPLPGHTNSTNAALAVEAAARQGELETMYNRMFETQPEWGESADSQASLFRSFAEKIGLDLEQYDEDIQDPAVLERVESDFNDGRALGISSTPTFFVNDVPLTLNNFEDLDAAVEDALAR